MANKQNNIHIQALKLRIHNVRLKPHTVPSHVCRTNNKIDIRLIVAAG